MTKKKKFDVNLIVKAGLIYKNGSRYTDRFRGRVIFPITDNQNYVIALAGRILPTLSGKGLAKYINSPETSIYHKSRSLYGLYQAKEHIKKEGFVVLVEGELDCLMSWQNGIRNIVAIKGTALTEEQITMLSRFTDKFVLALDQDFAGDSAQLRGIKMAQNQSLELTVAEMGKYKDPDEFSKADPEGYKNAIYNAKDVWVYVIETISSRYDLKTGAGKARAAKQILPLLAGITNNISKSHYTRLLSEKLDVDLDSINREANKFPGKKKTEVTNPEHLKNPVQKTRRQLLEEEAIVLAIRYRPEVLLKSDIKDSFSKDNIRLISLIDTYLRHKSSFSLKDFYENLPSEMRIKIEDLMAIYNEDYPNPQLDLAVCLKELLLLDLKAKRSAALTKMKLNPTKNKLKIVDKLTEKINKLEQAKNSSIIELGEESR